MLRPAITLRLPVWTFFRPWDWGNPSPGGGQGDKTDGRFSFIFQVSTRLGNGKILINSSNLMADLYLQPGNRCEIPELMEIHI